LSAPTDRALILIGVDGVLRYRGEADEVLMAGIVGDLGSGLASVVKPKAEGVRGRA
jgi:hypothetical protein